MKLLEDKNRQKLLDMPPLNIGVLENKSIIWDVLEKNSSIKRTNSIISPKVIKNFVNKINSEKLANLEIPKKNKEKTKKLYSAQTSTEFSTFPLTHQATKNCDHASVLAITTSPYNANTVNQDRWSLLKQVYCYTILIKLIRFSLVYWKHLLE